VDLRRVAASKAASSPSPPLSNYLK